MFSPGGSYSHHSRLFLVLLTFLVIGCGKEGDTRLVDFTKTIAVPRLISGVIRSHRERGCDLLLLTGGISVDPDDVTRHGIRQAMATSAAMVRSVVTPLPLRKGDVSPRSSTRA